MKTLKYILLAGALLGALWACDNDDNGATKRPTEPEWSAEGFARGADVSWLTEMEASGYKFYDNRGIETECMELLRDLGMNSIRLRAWVNPTDGWCNTQDLLIKAWRAKNLGMRIMVDFHYSDSWADPGQQNKPAAWVGLSLDELKEALSNDSVEVLQTLKDHGITPEWVQVGNETSTGMLWDDDESISGSAGANNGANYALLHNAGYDAVKSVFPDAKVILHLPNGQRNDKTVWLLNKLGPNGGKFDVLGFSLYPTADTWEQYNEDCLENMQYVVDNYGKEVMICEVGMDWQEAETAKVFLTDLIAKVASIQDESGKQMGTGVFYWEPQCYNWENYAMGAFNEDGVPTVALDAFAPTE